jgi:hypothetical protein
VEQFDIEPEIIARCSLQNIDRSANIGDNFWGMMNIMTTLGSTMPPLTIMGRVVSTLGLITGLCLLALLLNATTQAMSFTNYEMNVFETMEYQQFCIKRFEVAAALIEASWARYVARQKSKGRAFCLIKARAGYATEIFCRALHRWRNHKARSARAGLLAIDRRVAMEAKRAKKMKQSMAQGEQDRRTHSLGLGVDMNDVDMNDNSEDGKMRQLVAKGLTALEEKMDARFEKLEQLIMHGHAGSRSQNTKYSTPTHSPDGSVGRALTNGSIGGDSGYGSGYGDARATNAPKMSRRHSDSAVHTMAEDAVSSFRTTVRNFYQKYNPEKIDTVDKVIQQYVPP